MNFRVRTIWKKVRIQKQFENRQLHAIFSCHVIEILQKWRNIFSSNRNVTSEIKWNWDLTRAMDKTLVAFEVVLKAIAVVAV